MENEKTVYYNGQKETYLDCSDPNLLRYGQGYTVVAEVDRGWQTDYYLREVEGRFNSFWFDRIQPDNTFLAISDAVPIVGKCHNCSRIVVVDECYKLVSCNTGVVCEVEPMGNKVFKVKTNNSIYIVQVG